VESRMGFVGGCGVDGCRGRRWSGCGTVRRTRPAVGMTLGGYKTDATLYDFGVDLSPTPIRSNEEVVEQAVDRAVDLAYEMRAEEAEGRKKLFILDTNVVLHSFQCLFSFGKNDVCVPMTVLEELDKFKKGNEELHYNAREFLRTLDGLAADDGEGALAGEGIKLGDHYGKVNVCLDNRNSEIEELFFQDSPDHRILSSLGTLTVKERQKKVRGRDVILVTKDNNLRVKARAIGLLAQDYASDRVAAVEDLYSGRRTVENVPTEAINVFFEQGDGGDNCLGIDALKDLPELKLSPVPNESFVLRNCSRSVLASWKRDPSKAEFSFRRVEKRAAFNIAPRNSEQTFALNLLLDPSVRLLTISGKAGTGKTLLALAAALESRKQYAQIYLSRPVIPLSNRDSGHLPGDINTKLDPYMQPLWDNVGVIKSANMTKQFNGKVVENSLVKEIDFLIDSGFLKVAPLAYIRGRSFHDAYFIVDEAQNLTPHEVKTIITRAGEGTKIVLTGDINQIDNPYVDTRSNGLSYIIERMKGQSIYGHVMLERGERSELADLASRLL